MKKAISLVFFTIFISCLACAQNTDYDKSAAEIKNEIWGSKDPDFENVAIPDQYKNESAVIIAKRYSIDAKVKKHFRFSARIGNKEIIFRYLLRQKVLIQDKSALEDFSEISYNKISKSTFGMLFGKQTDELNTYIGARVTKKDGSVKEVMLSEAVLLKDEKNQKDEKLAISDLQVGDILDYYIVSLEKREMSAIDPMQFLIGGDYPILKFSLQGNIDKIYAIEYKCINGAPDLHITKDADGDNQFTLKVSDLPKYPSIQWVSLLRQVKVVRFKISLCGGIYGNCQAGEITYRTSEHDIYEKQKNNLRGLAFAYLKDYGTGEKDFVKENIKQLKKRLGKEPPADSIISTVYNSLRYFGYYETIANRKVYPGKSRNESDLSINYFSAFLSLCLTDYGVDNQIIFYSSRYMPRLEDLMSYDQPVFMVHAKGSRDYYLSDDGIFSQIDLVPGYAEGEKGVTLDYDNAKDIFRDKAKHLDQGKATIPVSKADKNKILQKLQVSLALSSSGSTATIERQITCKGLMKEDFQKSLLLFEDYYMDAWKDQGESQTFIQDFDEHKRDRTLADQWRTSFAKSRETYKDVFMEDVKGDYDLEPKELLSYKINQTGVKLHEPDFVYTTKFVMGDWIKKAGNNYLFEVGKLIGTQMQVKEEARKRTFDIYEPFARITEFQISLNIPDGYSPEGVEALNKKIENECGKFISAAAIQGNQIIINVKKEYSNNFEPAANWSKMLLFIDAAADFTNTKLLFKKK